MNFGTDLEFTETRSSSLLGPPVGRGCESKQVGQDFVGTPRKRGGVNVSLLIHHSACEGDVCPWPVLEV